MQNIMQIKYPNPAIHRQRVLQEMRQAGVSRLGLHRLVSRYLPNIVHPDEHIRGVVYGHNSDGSVMLVATNRRVLYLNKKPLFFDEDEVTYDVVSGIKYGHAGIGSTVTLHTRVKDYEIKTINNKSALRFVGFIERHCLEHHTQGVTNYDY